MPAPVHILTEAIFVTSHLNSTRTVTINLVDFFKSDHNQKFSLIVNRKRGCTCLSVGIVISGVSQPFERLLY